MNKLITALPLILLLTACGSSSSDNELTPEPLPPIVEPTPDPIPEPQPTPDPKPELPEIANIHVQFTGDESLTTNVIVWKQYNDYRSDLNMKSLNDVTALEDTYGSGWGYSCTSTIDCYLPIIDKEPNAVTFTMLPYDDITISIQRQQFDPYWDLSTNLKEYNTSLYAPDYTLAETEEAYACFDVDTKEWSNPTNVVIDHEHPEKTKIVCPKTKELPPEMRVFTINWVEANGEIYDSKGADFVNMSYEHADFFDDPEYKLTTGDISGDYKYPWYWYGDKDLQNSRQARVGCNQESCEMVTMERNIAPINITLDKNSPVAIKYSYTTYLAYKHWWEYSDEMSIPFDPTDYPEGVRYLTIDPVTQVITVDENQNPGPSHYEYIH